jgi:hypothetical protein
MATAVKAADVLFMVAPMIDCSPAGDMHSIQYSI